MPKTDSFETWLRCYVPWQLGLSPSKQVAMDLKFYQFEAIARALQKKAPVEYERFFNALQTKMEQVYKWRTPRGKKIVPDVYEGELVTFPNGKLKYRLIDKPKKRT